MHCKKCGKALGTDRGICPFCGAVLSPSQMEEYKEMKHSNYYKPELITEKYGEKPIVYEKREETSSVLFIILAILGLILIIGIIILFIVLKK